MTVSLQVKSKCSFKCNTSGLRTVIFNTWDFDILTYRPETLLKSSSKRQLLGRQIKGEVTGDIHEEGSFMRLWPTAYSMYVHGWVLMAIARVSMAIANICGDKGQPSLVPLDI